MPRAEFCRESPCGMAVSANHWERFRGCCIAELLDDFSHGGTEARRESQGRFPGSSSRIQECVLALCLRASVRKHVTRKVVRRVAVRYAAWAESCSRFCVCCLAQVLDSFSHGGTEARSESQGGVPSSNLIWSVFYLCAFVPL